MNDNTTNMTSQLCDAIRTAWMTQIFNQNTNN